MSEFGKAASALAGLELFSLLVPTPAHWLAVRWQLLPGGEDALALRAASIRERMTSNTVSHLQPLDHTICRDFVCFFFARTLNP